MESVKCKLQSLTNFNYKQNINQHGIASQSSVAESGRPGSENVSVNHFHSNGSFLTLFARV
jgi:hypothetical protein